MSIIFKDAGTCTVPCAQFLPASGVLPNLSLHTHLIVLPLLLYVIALRSDSAPDAGLVGSKNLNIQEKGPQAQEVHLPPKKTDR